LLSEFTETGRGQRCSCLRCRSSAAWERRCGDSVVGRLPRAGRGSGPGRKRVRRGLQGLVEEDTPEATALESANAWSPCRVGNSGSLVSRGPHQTTTELATNRRRQPGSSWSYDGHLRVSAGESSVATIQLLALRVEETGPAILCWHPCYDDSATF
jgi:hypothetical protein